MLTYTAGGKLKHVLAWDAINAIAPTQARAQVAFRLDYAGGWGKTHTKLWKTFGSRCGAYDGPPLAWKVAACKAPDGSYWALQAWQRMLPNYGVAPSAQQAAWELRLSHWTGDLPVLTIGTDWAWHQWDHLYGTFTYAGQPVYGFKSTPGRQPARLLRAEHLRRHVRLGLRLRLEAREQLPGAQRHRSVLLQLQPARCASGRQGREVPRDGRGARRHARRDVAGRRTRRVRQDARPGGERRDRAARRQAVAERTRGRSARLDPWTTAGPNNEHSSAAGRPGCRWSSRRSTGAGTG